MKPYLKRMPSFISIKALGTWQFPSHIVWHISTAVPQNGAFWNKESNLVLLQPAHQHFLLSSFLPKREVNLLRVYSRSYSAKFTTTATECGFPPFLWQAQGNTHQNLSPLWKQQPVLLGEVLWDPEIVLKPITNYFMKNPLNSSQVYNFYVSDWVLEWTAKTAEAQNRDHQQLPVPIQEIKATYRGTYEREIHNMPKLFLNTTHDS